jgi:hypothetical protein
LQFARKVEMKKSISHLVPKDFHVSPVWKPVDDLEDPDLEVMPFNGDYFHWEEMYLIGVQFSLADKSEWEGYIRYSWGKPIAMALAVSDNEFLLFSADKLGETETSHREFAAKLSKNEDDVFPIKYRTKVNLYLQSTVY